MCARRMLCSNKKQGYSDYALANIFVFSQMCFDENINETS